VSVRGVRACAIRPFFLCFVTEIPGDFRDFLLELWLGSSVGVAGVAKRGG